MAQIKLISDSRPHLARAIVRDTILTVTDTSSPDVYLHALPDAVRTILLANQDSVYLAGGTTVGVFLFRSAADGKSFSADLDFTEVQQMPAPKVK